jgi:hypothetical protein
VGGGGAVRATAVGRGGAKRGGEVVAHAIAAAHESEDGRGAASGAEERVGEGHPGADPDDVVGGVDAGVERCGKRSSDWRRVAGGEARGLRLRRPATTALGQRRDRLLILDGRLRRPAARPARPASASTVEDVDVVLCGIGPHVELNDPNSSLERLDDGNVAAVAAVLVAGEVGARAAAW